ncbi:hypothetical protein DNTS_015438 [Danionella cerebrum]|uniref:Uncharacterized protein n=1 Tax=Danionella cerebrum TaxID=2873325 RepID=A0A553NIK0_9TELE|nr:hypothetical protein DNTS_015438 [Danionella translucida]
MIVSQKSNDTLAMCHILDRSVVCHLCSSVQTPSRPRLLNLTHSISLPEREDLPKEVLDWCNLTQNDKSSLAGKTDEKRTRKSRGYKSSPTLCVLSENTSWLKKEPLTHRGTSRRHNLFIPETELNEDEEDEDSDGDNLHKYHEGSSLQLQGNVTRCGSEEKKDREYEGHSDRKGTPVLMDCDEQEWGEGENFGNHTPEETENCWAPTEDYITDSSCTSSDGIIVNFSAIYDKSNNAVPASPINLDSPVHRVSHHWSSDSIDPNCNVYQSNGGFSTVEISDLSMHQQSLTRFANSTKNYYKLVTCDVSQCSPSPPWSSLTSFSETQSPGSSSPSEYFLFGDAKGEQREKIKCDQQVNAEVKNDCRISKEQCKGTNERTADRKSATPRKDGASVKNKASIPNLTALQQSCSSHLDTNLSSSSSGHHATTFAEIVQTKRGTGDCSFKKSTDALSSLYFTRANPNTDNSIPINPEDTSSPEVLRYTKAQRPNFLPIQPFVLQSRSGQQPNKALGSLLDQYINNKHTNPGPHKATCKTKGLSENIPLETTTSLDTCSTCTSSPIQMLLSPKRPGSGMNAPECMPLVQAILEPRKRSKDSLYASIHLHTNSSSATTSVTSLVSNSISSLEAASLDSTQASHTSKPSLLKAVSLAVDLVLAHFNLRSNPDEKISLGNSLQCSTINNLVLKELYPTVLNILQHVCNKDVAATEMAALGVAEAWCIKGGFADSVNVDKWPEKLNKMKPMQINIQQELRCPLGGVKIRFPGVHTAFTSYTQPLFHRHFTYVTLN